MKILRIRKAAVVIILLVLIIGVLLYASQSLTGKSVMELFRNKEKSSQEYVMVSVTKENLPQFLNSISIIDDLPENGEIELRLFNFNSGERSWEETYVMKQGGAYQGNAENPDVIILLHSKYVTELGNICPTLQQANRNGDLGFEFHDSTASLLWKYKKIVKYKDCLGL